MWLRYRRSTFRPVQTLAAGLEVGSREISLSLGGYDPDPLLVHLVIPSADTITWKGMAERAGLPMEVVSQGIAPGSVPEPATGALISLALAGLVFAPRSSRRRA